MEMSGHPLSIFNTKTRKKEEVAFFEGRGQMLMYTCGPTLYDFPHIGNWRTYVFEDVLRRTLEYFGMPVFQVMNLTDVDDKTIQGASAKGMALGAYTQLYKDAFFRDLDVLRIRRAAAYPCAVDYIDAMIDMIQTLLDKGLAYRSGRDVFFSVRHFPDYGSLSRLPSESLKADAAGRMQADEYDKRSAADFALWKGYDPKRDGACFWKSPFGIGRPGWHIECAAMATQLLGTPIDLHLGGVDNIFPHHENEIAQAEGCTGKPFVRYWMHVEHLLVDGKKMSKSLGNAYTLRDLLDRGYFSPEIRYFLLSTHYRHPLNFTFSGLKGARRALMRLEDLIYRLQGIRGKGEETIIYPAKLAGKGEGGLDLGKREEVEEPLSLFLQRKRGGFRRALGDDLNIPSALAILFEMVHVLHTQCDAHRIGRAGAEELLSFLGEVDAVLALFSFEEMRDIAPEIAEAFWKRQAARAAKRWAEADRYREVIFAKGYCIEDHPEGSRLKKRGQ